MFGAKDKPSHENATELKPLLAVNKGGGTITECDHARESKAQGYKNQPGLKPYGDTLLEADGDRKDNNGSQPSSEDRVEGIHPSGNALVSTSLPSRNPVHVNEPEATKVDRQMRGNDRNLSFLDERNSDSDDAHSDKEEPVYRYEEPNETETVDDPYRTDRDYMKVTCFGRSHRLRKKFDKLSLLIYYNSVDKIVKMLDEESEVDQAKLLVQRDNEGQPCMIKAIKRRSFDCLKLLFEKFEKLQPIFDNNGIDKLDALKAHNQKNLFHIGAEIATDRDIIDAIEMCPLKEVIADMTDCCDVTPLIVACQRKNHQMAVRLVSYKAKIDRVDQQGNSPIYWAAANGCADLLKLFFVHGCRDSKDFWSLISKNKFYRWKGTILQAILESKSPDTLRACTDNEVLGFDLIRRCLEEELAKDQHFFHKICRTPLADLVEIAVQFHESLLHVVDDKGMTPLMTATMAGQFEVVKLILDHPCGQNTVPRKRESDQQTALMIACVEGQHEIAKHIMETSDVRLEDLDNMKRNVFHHAAKHTNVLKALIDVCSEIEKYKNFRQCLQKQDDSGYVSIHLAAAVGSHKNVKLLLENGVPYDTPSSRVGRHALHYAACTNLSTVKALVEFVKANYGVNAMETFIDAADSRSHTSLHLAASLGKWRTVSYLLEKGATIKCDHEQETPLHHASASGCIKTVKCILKRGTSFVNQENRVGETAAMFAAVEGHAEILQLLLKKDACLYTSTDSLERCCTCLDWAVKSNRSDTAASILDVKDWKEVMEKSHEGPDGLLALMAEKMPKVAVKVLDKCIMMPSKSQKVYDFFCLQTVEEVTTCGSKEPQVVSTQAIQSMVEGSRDECLRHVVVQKFLQEKWVRRVRPWWMMTVFVYAVFILSLTTYIDLIRKGSKSTEKPGGGVAGKICVVFASFCISTEIVTLFYKKQKYFQGFTTYMHLVMYISAFIFLPNAKKSNHQWQAGAIAIFLGWINLIWFLKTLPTFGIYIIMVKKIFLTFVKVSLPLTFFTMAFAMTFFVLMPDDPGFQTIPRAWITSNAMLVGGIDYRGTFLEQKGANLVLIMMFLMLFLVLMTILLMNLLTGLAVGDIGKILERSKAEKRTQQALFILDTEKSLKIYPCLKASYIKPLTETFPRKKPTGLAKVARILKEPLFPNLDGEGADERLSGCQCAALKDQISEMKTTLEVVKKSLTENKQDGSIRRASKFIKKLQLKQSFSL